MMAEQQKNVIILTILSVKDKLAEYTANIAFAGFTAPKILWLRENEPENFQKIKQNHASKGLSCI